MARDINGFCTGCQRHASEGCQCPGTATEEASPGTAPRATPAAPAAAREAPGAAATFQRRLSLTPASEITPRPVRWGWEGRIPVGHLTLVPGREGIGKSLFLADLCAKVTRGELDGCWHGEPRPVIYCASEDSWPHTLVPRLIAAGADLDLVYRADVQAVESATGEVSALQMIMPRDIELMAAEVERLGVAVIALDPLMSVIDSHIDTHSDRELRTALEPLGKMADDTGCMIVGLAHFNKGGGNDPLNLVTGSRAFTAYVRAVLAIARDPDAGNGQCVISQVKNNLGLMDVPHLAYVIESADIPTPEGQAAAGRIVYTGESAKGVRDILADDANPADRSERAACGDWLRDKLASGPVRTKEIEDEAKANGYSESTLNRARRKLGVKANLITNGKRNEWWLELPRPAAPA